MNKLHIKAPNHSQHLEKAYKVLSMQEGISHKSAKDLIDRGRVSLNHKTLSIARTLIPKKSHLKITPQAKLQVIFEDDNLLAINKPPFIDSQEVANLFNEWVLLHRLDKATSGILLLVKNESEFHKQAKEAFKQEQVYKEYIAIVNGIFKEDCILTNPLLIEKGKTAKVKVLENDSNHKKALHAHTQIQPIELIGKKTKLKIIIKTGRTHQIRAHLAHIGYAILGDTFYGGKEHNRLMLHAHKISILGYNLQAPLEQSFNLQ